MALTNYVLMPGADYLALCNAIRAKTGKTETLKSGDLASEVEGITGGGNGGSVEGVHTVTFMSEDGATVLYERLVVDGDDCANVVDRGLLATPTKASTVQYNYTHSGWSLTSGGSASASALAAVTADRTVYAAFTSAVREYTITYLDSDGSVLKTESLAYGSVPNYEPTKDDYDFVAWTPTPVAVTGDASYSATWQMKAAFATASWDEISEIVTNGNAATTFNIGDERTETLTWSDGTTEEVVLQIASLDGLPTTTAGSIYKEKNDAKYMVLITKGVLSKTSRFSNSPSTFTTYYNGPMRTFVEGTVIPALPEDLQSVLKSVTESTWFDQYCKVSIPEAYHVGINPSDRKAYTGSACFPFFTDNNSRKKTDPSGTVSDWWTKSSDNSTSSQVDQIYITKQGYASGISQLNDTIKICLMMYV